MGTLKILMCTHPSLVQHQKLTLYANFHTSCRKSRHFIFFYTNSLDYNTCFYREKNLIYLADTVMSLQYNSTECFDMHGHTIIQLGNRMTLRESDTLIKASARISESRSDQKHPRRELIPPSLSPKIPWMGAW